jgi:hypothetical protein
LIPLVEFGPCPEKWRFIMNSMLKKMGLGAVLAATALSSAVPAEAQRHGGYRGGYHGGYHGHRGGDAAGAALLGGIVGLGLGAAIASNHGGYYDRSYYYDRRYYYDRPHYYRPHCWSQWRWDPYWGRDVRVRVCD